MKRKFFLLLTMFFIGIGMATAQIQVRGVVVDEAGEPAVGATIQLKGTAQGTVTDIDGNFTLSAPADGTLVISYVGYTTQEVPVSADMSIRLQTDSQLLDEFVFIGYMSRKITATSASVVKVSSKVIEEKPTANAMDALQGKVAGLQVYTSSGEPSQFSSLKLHGVGSLGAGSDPLYIVDGVPVSEETIRSMNTNDFESFQVLKDAAATSIYGARAANGVIYITTKRGKEAERAQITARASYGVSNLANPDYYRQLMNTNELLQVWQELGIRTESQIKEIKDRYGNNNTEWWKYYLRQNTPTYQADVAIRGGNNSTNYYVSGGLFSQEGMRVGSDYNKFNVRTNLSSQLNKITRIGLNTNIAYDLINLSPYARNSTIGGGIAMLAPPYFTYIDPATGKEYEELIPGWNRLVPKYDTSKTPSTEKTIYINSAGNVELRPVNGLTLRSQVGLELADYFYDRSRLASHRSALANGFGTKDFYRKSTWTFTNTAQYSFNVADANNINFLLGHEFIDYKRHYIRANASGMQDDRLMLLPNGTNKTVDETKNEYAFLSYFGQLSYDFREKYFVDLVLRNDASSRFGKNRQNALFWSAGFLWKAKKENFLTDTDWLDVLDLRFSIGTQGNADIENYQSYALAGQIGQYGEQPGWGLTSPGNDDLAWERQRKITFGLKSELFKKLTIDIEAYHRLTSDMLMDVPLPLTTGVPLDDLGFASVTRNVGKYLNRGIDLRLDYSFINRKDASLNSYINFSYNQDKVVELFQDRNSWILPGYGFGYIVGQPVTFVYPIFKQVNPETGVPEWYLPGEDIAITRKDEVTSDFSDTLEQNTGVRLYTPIVGGFGLSGEYKGFYLQSDFTYALGKNMISNDRFFYENPYVFPSLNQSKRMLNYWKQAGDVTDLPGLKYVNKGRFMEFDSRLIENASFLRLKNLSIGYNIPQKYLDFQNILTGAKIYVTGRNILTFTKYTGPDPEVDSNLSLGAYPNSKQFIVGFELNF